MIESDTRKYKTKIQEARCKYKNAINSQTHRYDVDKVHRDTKHPLNASNIIRRFKKFLWPVLSFTSYLMF